MDNVSLREVTINDAFDLQPIWTDFDVIKYTMINDMESIDNVKSRIERQLKWKDFDGIGPFVILMDNAIIGYCGGTKTNSTIKEYEIFYHLRKEEWGKGIGTKVVKMLIEIAFESKKAGRVIAETVVENIGSCRVLEKIGMKRREIIKRKIRNNKVENKMFVYEIIK